MRHQRLATHILLVSPIRKTRVTEIWLTDASQVLRRAIITYNDLEVFIRLALDAVQHLVKKLSLVGRKEKGVFGCIHENIKDKIQKTIKTRKVF